MIIEYERLLQSAGLVAEILARQGEHGQAIEAGETGCAVCDAIWSIREAVAEAGLTIVIRPSADL